MDGTSDDDAAVEATIADAGRLDKALAAAAPGFSRSRLAALIAEGAVRRADGGEVTDPALKVKPGERFVIAPPPPAPAAPEPEAIPLDIVIEDAALIVVDKPAGLAVHPAPGAERGTLVAALLHHCGDTLSGIGGVARPGIVHRLDKETTGLLVVAKTDAAHAALAAQFAARETERRYLAATWGAPDRADPRLAGLEAVSFAPDGALTIDAPIARHPRDRKRMAVVAGGRRAVTHLRLLERFGPAERPHAALVACRLETGRTHQIRVHLAHIGHPLIGDPVYGRPRAAPDCARAFTRQALHAESLGFTHPDGRRLRFERPPPEDFARLVDSLRKSSPILPH
jgi:23S rRNA pseudouridine1911/1915/1917 synthase